MQRTRPGIRERDARRTEALLLCLVLLTLITGGALALLARGGQNSATTSAPAGGALNINTATAAQLAQRLGVSNDTGKRLVEQRQKQNGFADVDALARVPIVTDARGTAERLRRAGLATPSVASRAQMERALKGEGNNTLAARIINVRDARPGAQTWERVLRAPLVSPTAYAKAKPSLLARSWEEARRTFLISCGILAGFLVIAHFTLRFLHPRADPFLLPLAGFLSVLGVLLLFAIKDPLRDMPTFAAQASGIVIGGGIALLAAWARPLGRLPLHRYGYLYALAAVVGTLILGVLGSGPGGVKLSVGGTQPVEVIKILLVFFLAAYLAERGPLLADPLRMVGPFPVPRRRDAFPLLALYALPLVLFALVKDLGPVLLLFGAFLLLTYLATGRGVYVLLGVVALGAGGVVGYALHFGVFQTRVLMWMSPWSNVKTGGDQLALGLWGMSSGGPLGSGLGLGGTRFIPRGGSDLALAALGEEAGLVATVAVTLCFLVIALRGLVIARRATTDFDRLLAAGLSGLIGIQALVIIAGTLGLFPLAGVTLPFISNGKSSLVASFFIVGVLLALSAKSPSSANGVPPLPSPRAFTIASARVGVFFSLTLGAFCIVRLVWVQAVRADFLATHMVRTPDADGVRRPHVNPRLLAIAERIGRGRLLDRKGKVVAETRNGKRVYPYGGALAHLVGYVDPAVGGPTGFEETLSLQLRGFDTSASLLPTWRTKDLPGARLPQGKDVTLTLDAELQKNALALLQAGAARVRDRRTGRAQDRGAVVVLDVQTGGVLAAVTSPTFDPGTLTPARMQSLTADLNNDYPLINRARDGYYPPGSTFKIVTASALLATGKADFTTDCAHIATNIFWKERNVPYGRRRIVDDEGDRPHGLTNLTEAVSESCNVYFGKAGIALGSDALHDHAARYGFARLPSLLDFDITLPDAAYGQGRVLASPMEMAGVALTVASGGKRLASQFVPSNARPVIADTPLSSGDAARLADMMRRVTISGTASGRFDDLPFTVAGKTGTAQNDQRDRAPHSWFIGFAPAIGPPKIAFAVVVENGGYGAQTAVPIAHDVLRAALR